MTQFPALPLFVREYRMDTLHLSTLQHGTYLLLLMQAWGSPQCRLPDDDEKLAAWANLSLADWGSLRHSLEPFFIIRGGWWSQKRLSKEWHFVYERQQSARSRGKMGGIASALKKKEKRDSLAQQQLQSKLSLATTKAEAPTPTPKPTRKKKNTSCFPKKNTKNSKIAQGQEPTPSQTQAATKAGLSELERRSEWEKFLAYNRAKGSVFADWDAAWGMWLGNVAKPKSHDQPPRCAPPLPPPIELTEAERRERATMLRTVSAEIAKTALAAGKPFREGPGKRNIPPPATPIEPPSYVDTAPIVSPEFVRKLKGTSTMGGP